MTLSTIERAYALARSGQVPDVARLKARLTSDGCRAVDALLAPRSIRGHLEAICAAAFNSPQSAGAPVSGDAAESSSESPHERDATD